MIATSAQPELDRGRPGASAAREYQRRKDNRAARVRDTHPLIGGMLLTFRSAPQHEVAFHQGEVGEQTVAASLEKRTAGGPAIILHDRRMPGGHGNIDHLAIAPTGVFVIDAKNIHGKVRVAKPLFEPQRLLINERNRTKLIDGLDRQVSTVSRALELSDYPDVPIRGVLCFTTADLPLFSTLTMRRHLMLHPRALAKRLNASGSLQPSTIDTLARTLALSLPPA
ncbi:MAG: nuclease-related domain-containing protein [Solirubrobacteraceae bacterium]